MLERSLALLPLTLAYVVCLTALSVVLGFAIEKSAFGRSRQIFALPIANHQLRWELYATVRFCIMAGLAFAFVLGSGALGRMEETTASRAFTCVVLWLGFDFYYYLIHRALHHRSLMRFHRWHHRSRVTTPLTGFSMGCVESAAWVVGWVGVAWLASRTMPLSLDGLLGYGVLVFTTNILGHTNVEWFPSVARSRALSWLAHPITYHALHHARYTKHFAFGCTAFDRVFHTEWDDWSSLFARVLEGRPLTRLQERGEPSKGGGDGELVGRPAIRGLELPSEHS